MGDMEDISEESRPRRALLVDDDPIVQRSYARMLHRLGFSAIVASDGREAAEHLNVARFDVILSDLAMPRMGGLELLRLVRQYDPDVPVVLMTADPGLETAIEAIEQGAFRYLTKPVELERLAEVLRRVVSLNEMARLKREAMAVLGTETQSLRGQLELGTRFTRALDGLWVTYQPIVHAPGRSVFGYEALVRSSEPSLQNPSDLVEAGERLGRLHDLGRRIRECVACSAVDAPPDALIFVNIHAVDLNDFDLYSAGSPLATIAPRVVLEVTERFSLQGVGGLVAKTVKLRGLGFRIAVDDLGSGYAGFASFSQLEPEFVKLDVPLVRGIDVFPRKRAVVRAIARLCAKDLQIQVIGEGVETSAERDCLVADGCTLLQGHLFAKPARGFPTPQW